MFFFSKMSHHLFMARIMCDYYFFVSLPFEAISTKIPTNSKANNKNSNKNDGRNVMKIEESPTEEGSNVEELTTEGTTE